jgi:beta-lactamase class A
MIVGVLDLAPLLTELRRDDYGGTGVVSVHAATLDGRLLTAYDDDAVHLAASTVKLPMAMAAYRLHARGVLDLDAEVPVHDDFASEHDGSRFVMDEGYDQDPPTWAQLGGTCSLRELVRRAIVHSGNLATNLVLERVGTDAVAELIADAGCSSDTVMSRGIEDSAALEAGYANEATARDLGTLLAALGNGTLLGPGPSKELEAVLAQQTHRDGIPAGLPTGTYVANKTGWIEDVTHDAALVRPAWADPFTLVVLTSLGVPTEEANRRIARVARAVHARLEVTR